MAKTKFLFSTDFHGSETLWRKFLNSAKYYDLDAIILGGDILGKLMIPIVERSDGKYDATLQSAKFVLTKDEIPEFSKKCRLISYLPYVTTPEEVDRIAADETYREDLFEKLEHDTVRSWLSLIPDRVPANCKVLLSPGNDDRLSLDDVIRDEMKNVPNLIFGKDEVIRLDDDTELLCFSWSNPTPFDSPRECSEEEIEKRLEKVAQQVEDTSTAVFCIHVPPHDTIIDYANMPSDDLKYDMHRGHTRMSPVGSTAVRKIIEKYQPLLGLHGHIHESPGIAYIGRTQCINPGSEYTEGILKAYLVEIDGDKILQLTTIEA